MTMTSLLRRFGHDAPRRVTSAGIVTFDAVASSEPGLSMRPHTFHGGVAEPDAVAVPAPWWEDEELLRVEREAMAKSFPTFVELPAEDDLPLTWAGTIDTGRGRFQVLVLHRADHSLPAVIPVKPAHFGRTRGRRFVQPPHLYLNGHLCIASAEDWRSDRDTAATVVAWTAHWYACYTEWLATDRWPTEGLQLRAA